MPINAQETGRESGRVEVFFFSLFVAVLAVSPLVLMFLAYTQKELFSAFDPAVFVLPFLGCTLAMPSAALAALCLPLYAHSRMRFWLYLGAAFGSISLILFLTASFAIAYLIIR
ncbi:MAG: hypothetical protein ACM3OC_01850 [Deltaproteobacteria bacterium]